MRIACIVMLTLFVAGTVCAATLNPDSPFGVVCPWSGMKEAGVDWVRGGAGATDLGNWFTIENQKGVYAWGPSDDELKDDLEQGLIPLPILGYTPHWASSGPEQKASAPPKDMLDYARFVRDAVSRYKSQIPCWEMWNEEDIGFFLGSISQYADLLKSGYTAAKVADPKCKVVFGGTAGVDIPFTKAVYECGARDYFDIMAVHPYQWAPVFNDEAFVSQLSELRNLMNSQGDSHKEIWLTELGWATSDKNITEDIQARLLTEVMVTTLTLKDMGVTKAFWFCVKDWGGPGYGLLRDDGNRKPAYTAYATLTKVLRGAEYAGRLSLGEGVRCHLFVRANPRKVIAVIWTNDKNVPIKLPVSNAEAIDYMGRSVTLSPDADGVCAIDAKPQPVFVVGVSSAALPKAAKPKLPAYIPKPASTKPPVTAWASLVAPESTMKPYLTVGARSTISVRLQNQGSKAIEGKLSLDIKGMPKIKPVKYHLQANHATVLNFRVDVPAGAKAGSAKCTIHGDNIRPTDAVIGVSSGRLIEFFANSFTERQYMAKNEKSGGAPSVRFGGTWTYKFDLTGSKAAAVRMELGSEYKVLASSDQQNWKTILAGMSDKRLPRRADLSEFVGKPLYLKFEGKDQQFGGLALTY